MKTFAEFVEASDFEPTPYQLEVIDQLEKHHPVRALIGTGRRMGRTEILRLYTAWLETEVDGAEPSDPTVRSYHPHMAP